MGDEGKIVSVLKHYLINMKSGMRGEESATHSVHWKWMELHDFYTSFNIIVVNGLVGVRHAWFWLGNLN
jgi:hypothetical protein